MRIDEGVTRGPAFEILVDGRPCPAFAGETVAAAMLAHGRTAFRRDTLGSEHGLFCNMGTCCECMVTIDAGEGARRLRACLVDAAPGQRVTTHG